jgi:hypothetical protein
MGTIKLYMVTGTFHGSHIYAFSEGEARRIFHDFYNGESITHVAKGFTPEPPKE